MFGNRYFGPHYFGDRYFGPALIQVAGGSLAHGGGAHRSLEFYASEHEPRSSPEDERERERKIRHGMLDAISRELRLQDDEGQPTPVAETLLPSLIEDHLRALLQALQESKRPEFAADQFMGSEELERILAAELYRRRYWAAFLALALAA